MIDSPTGTSSPQRASVLHCCPPYERQFAYQKGGDANKRLLGLIIKRLARNRMISERHRKVQQRVDDEEITSLRRPLDRLSARLATRPIHLRIPAMLTAMHPGQCH